MSFHGHTHSHHGPHLAARGDHRSPRARILYTLVLSATVMVAETVGGWVSGSLALLADAGHMLTDTLALFVAFAAITLSAKPADSRRTYGYRRLEVLAALLNGVALVIISGTIIVEAIERWMTPHAVDAGTMSLIAALGLLVNLAGLWLLGAGRHNINVRGAFLHVLGDTLSSVGVLFTGGLIAWTGWSRADVVVSIAIAVVIVVSSVALLREVIDVLLESVPRGLDIECVRRVMTEVDGVNDVHDLHIWCITSGMPALSAHVVVPEPSADHSKTLKALQHKLRERFDIEHATLQLERDTVKDCGC